MLDKDRVTELVMQSGLHEFGYGDRERFLIALAYFATAVQHEVLKAAKRGDAEPVAFEFSDKGVAEVVVCPKGLTYGVRCIDFPKVFAQFTFESDAQRFVEMFNGTVAPRVESPVTGGGGGFESRPVSANTTAVVRQLVEALDKAQDLIAGYLETFEKRGDKMPYGHKVLRQAQEALAAAKEAGL